MTVELPSIDTLIPLLSSEDVTFSKWRDAMPDKHWAKLDLSALRIGYELGKAAQMTLLRAAAHYLDTNQESQP